jgi:hypothetical protein
MARRDNRPDTNWGSTILSRSAFAVAGLSTVLLLAACQPASTGTGAPVDGAGAGPAAALPVGTAPPDRVQPQPPPGSCHNRKVGRDTLPDPVCTPGATNPKVTGATLRTTICRGGYTKSIRPSENITRREKLASMKAYGDPGPPSRYEYDHLVSLELGGSANDAGNLWPEPGASPNRKDRLENKLHSLVCAGSVSLATAQHDIASDWISAYTRYVGGS